MKIIVQGMEQPRSISKALNKKLEECLIKEK
jgi:hypothetical protein